MLGKPPPPRCDRERREASANPQSGSQAPLLLSVHIPLRKERASKQISSLSYYNKGADRS